MFTHACPLKISAHLVQPFIYVNILFYYIDYRKTKKMYCFDRKGRERIFPLFLIIVLILFIPLCILFTLNITANMTRFSRFVKQEI